MSLTQTIFAGRNDDCPLNVDAFSFAPDTNWTQRSGVPFRVRFGVSGTGTVGGTLEFSTDGTAFTPVSDLSGTVQAARSTYYADGASTTAVLSNPDDFVTGSADEDSGVVEEITLDSEHTEVEYCVRLIPGDTSAGGTITLRVAGVDTYTRKPALTVSISALDQIRVKVGDTDMNDPLLTDAEISAHIAAWPNNLSLAAANAADAIAAKYARGFNFSTDGQTFNRRERFLHYMELAQSLRRGGYLVWPWKNS